VLYFFFYGGSQDDVKPLNYYKFRPNALISQSPIFNMNDKQQNFDQVLLLSLPMLATYLNFQSVKEISYRKLVLRLKDSSAGNQNKVINEIKDQMPSFMVNNILFFVEGNETLETVDSIVTLIFDLVIVITMFLCFFALSSSMGANLMEQGKEIGILRAIGFTKIRIILLYVYEAFILVMASSMMGILVGVGVAFSMTMQFTVL